jgi:hypothetical protein
MQTSITYSLNQLLQQFAMIKIPMIQRDYAQGRDDTKDVRNSIISSFIDQYKRRKADVKHTSLNLDFIFGDTIIEGSDKNFQPLDGQQRITTLFLLHWYAALCNNQIDTFKQQFVNKDGKSKLSYQVRQSSNDFFNQLVHTFPNINLLLNHNIKSEQRLLSAYITNQSWFFLSWHNDPTIQSALTMLDSIHNQFMSDALSNQYKCAENLYELLTSTNNPLITFQFLPLEGFGLSEDLYIKMNARGKPLTTFENTKAKIEQFLLNTDKNLHSEFRTKIDSSWSDLLWQFRNQQTNVFDRQFMNLFRHVMIVTHNIDLPNNEYDKDIQSLRDFKHEFTFQRYTEMKLINKENIHLLFTVLNHWSKLHSQITLNKVNTIYFDEEWYVNSMFSENPTPLTYEQLIIFYAYITYIEKTNGKTDAQGFKDWMRIISNLARNSIYNRPEDFSRSLRFIKSILNYSEESIVFFSKLNIHQTSRSTFGSVAYTYENEEIKGSFYEQQLREEILKAQLILISTDWQKYIEAAESHKYFKGQIEFLFVFAGLFDVWNQNKSVSWIANSDEDKQYQYNFSDYLARISIIFDSIGINLSGNTNKERLITKKDSNKNPEFIWERALLTKGDYLSTDGRNKNLLFNDDRSFDWKRLLRGSNDGSDTRRMFVKAVLDDIEEDTTIIKTLKKIISSAESDTSIEQWRQMLIREPKCIAYCEKRNIRFSQNEPIYLLKKTQMNGEHVELYSYYTYMHTILPMIDKLKPFSHVCYESMYDTKPPYVHLSDIHINDTNKNGKIDLKIIVETKHQGKFTLELTDRLYDQELTFLYNKKWNLIGTQSNTNYLVRTYQLQKVDYDALIPILRGLVKMLQTSTPRT